MHNKQELSRMAGILLHPTSLPGKYGIGDFGKSAMDFVDFLKKANQGLWQILPLSPTSFGDSPYQSFSTFAGNTLLLSPDELVKEGYLTNVAIEDFDPTEIDYGKVILYKERIFKEAFASFKSRASQKQKAAFKVFCTENEFWLNDFTLFLSLKQHYINKRKIEGFSTEYNAFYEKAKKFLSENEIKDYYFGGSWISFEEGLKNRDAATLKTYSELLADEVLYHSFLQYEFFRQWGALKRYATENGVSVMGDIPIYVAYDSSDCWANQRLYMLDKDGFPLDVAGVPPDYFSETGQLWGNPLYNWKEMEKNGFKWWIKRVEKTFEMCDYIRIDHFRGFDTYWAVPYGDKTAVRGEWRKGPREKLLDALFDALDAPKIIAEDLGEPAKSFVELRDAYELPGMKVLQFAFESNETNAFLPHNYDTRNCVVYTGTHDNDTTKGWYDQAPDFAEDYLRRYLRVDGSDVSWDLIRLAYSSVAAFAVVPLQDCFSLGEEARMNTPSVASGNWKWRYTEDMLTESIAYGLSYLTKIYARG